MIDAPSGTAHQAPDHVMLALNWALHALFAGLWLVAVVQAFSLDDGERLFSLAAASCLLLVYGLGAVLPRLARGQGALLWVAALVVLWTLLIVHVPSAAYLAFPLFFLCLHVLPLRSGSLAVVLVCVIAVVTIGTQQEWTIGGVAGPTVAAAAAIAVAVGYRSLMDTRAELAAKERAAGQEAERTRLAGEIHDTIAQELASIQMLLRAVERSAPEHPSIDDIRLARETAGNSLHEARRVVAALRPAVLEGTTLAGALERVALHAPALPDGTRPRVRVTGTGDVDGGVRVSSALVRIAQEAVSNAVRHGHATQIEVSATRARDGIELIVRDNGTGFDTARLGEAEGFGLENMRLRLDELGGRLSVDSQPGVGTVLGATAPVRMVAGDGDNAAASKEDSTR